MSLLLDALRKADRERRTGQPDSPFDVAPPPHAPPPITPPAATAAHGSSQRALLAVLWGILIAVLILAIAVWQRPSPGPVAPTVTAAAPVTPPPTALPTPAPTPPRARATAPQTLAPFEPLYSLDELAMPALQPIDTAPPTVTAPAADITRVEILPSPGVEVMATAPNTGTAPPTAPPLPTADALPGDVMQRRDLPAAVRDRVPNYAIDVHVYNSDPTRRFILISGQRFVEGTSLEGGHTLLEIVSRGLIIDVDGQKVFIPRPG